jgi:hypothetical protein
LSPRGNIGGLALAALLAAAGAWAQTPKAPKPPQAAAQSPDARYQALVTAAKAGDASVDWQAMRFAYADRPSFSPEAGDDEAAHARKMREDYQTGDFANAIEEAKAVMDVDFVDAEAHLIASQAYAKRGDQLSAGREQAIAVGLLKSIQTGDGSSAAQAFTVIRVKEEYVMMATSGRRVTRQSLQQIEGHSYDVLETVNRAGETATVYFQIDRVRAAEANVLQIH